MSKIEQANVLVAEVVGERKHLPIGEGTSFIILVAFVDGETVASMEAASTAVKKVVNLTFQPPCKGSKFGRPDIDGGVYCRNEPVSSSQRPVECLR